jgi:DNA repair photolyase
LIKIHEVKVKSLLRKHRLEGTYFPGKFTFSPYRACQHSCKYCDGRAEKYYVEGDFENDIIARINAPEKLREELGKLRERGYISIGSGVSDIYQPAEAKLQLTRQCLEVISEFDFPVSLMTKSVLLRRDLDILQKINKKAHVNVMISMIYTNDDLRKIFEPFASPVKARLKLAKECKDLGFSVGILAQPFLPFLTDSEAHFHDLANLVKSVKADFIMPGLLTLRPGIQKQCYLAIIEKHFPQYLGKYLEIYSENRVSGSPKKNYCQKIGSKFSIFSEYQLSQLFPHDVYHNVIPNYDEIFVLLAHMNEVYAYKNIDTTRLKESLKKYILWITEQKKWYARRRNHSYLELERQTKFMLQTKQLLQIIPNEKLVSFLCEVILEDKLFDYFECKLH